jgi:hypothetical protein
MLSEPAPPADDAPLVRLTLPLAPLVDEPELTDRAPLTPAEPASAEANITLPLFAVGLVPLAITVDCPCAESTTWPPWVAVIATFEPIPAKELAEAKLIEPVAPPLRFTLPPELPAAATMATFPPAPGAAEAPALSETPAADSLLEPDETASPPAVPDAESPDERTMEPVLDAAPPLATETEPLDCTEEEEPLTSAIDPEFPASLEPL